jgi:hypothetical protein
VTRAPTAPPDPHPRQNHLLAALSPEVQGRLFPHLELAELPLRALMYESGQPMRHVYFPTDSIISMQYLMENGASTAISVVGNEGLLGITLYMGGESTPSRSLVQSAGHAYRLPRPRVKEEFDRHGELLLLLMLRYTQALITQVAQTAVCNRHRCDPDMFLFRKLMELRILQKRGPAFCTLSDTGLWFTPALPALCGA